MEQARSIREQISARTGGHLPDPIQELNNLPEEHDAELLRLRWRQLAVRVSPLIGRQRLRVSGLDGLQGSHQPVNVGFGVVKAGGDAQGVGRPQKAEDNSFAGQSGHHPGRVVTL